MSAGSKVLFFSALLAVAVNARALPSYNGDIVIREDDVTIREPSDFIKPGIGIRGMRVVNPNAVSFTTCSSNDTAIVSHDINVALLAICGGIAGTIEQCGGSPTTTTGSLGTALLTLTAATEGQTIDITKGRWEGCMAAARAVCGDHGFTSQCIGGADVNAGNVNFTLVAQ